MFYPWGEYVKVGAVLRHCAYEVMALHGCLHSEIQVYVLDLIIWTHILSGKKKRIKSLKNINGSTNTLHCEAKNSIVCYVFSNLASESDSMKP